MNDLFATRYPFTHAAALADVAPKVLRNWLDQYPDTREGIEPLVSRARGELAAGGPGRAYRELFRKLRDRLG